MTQTLGLERGVRSRIGNASPLQRGRFTMDDCMKQASDVDQ